MPSCFSMPPMRCSRPGVPGTAHGRARVCGSRLYGQNTSVPSASVVVRARWRTARAGRAVRRRPGSATARSRWPGSRRRAGRPGCGRSARSGRPRWRRRSSRPGCAGATIGTGASPLRPNIACSRSACSVLVGRPVDGPPRWMSTMSSGSSSETASPIVSDFSATPGPGGRGHRRARRRTPRPAPRRCPAISSSAWKVRTPKFLCLRQLVQDVRGRGDRVRAQEQRQIRLLGDAAISP